MASIHSLFGPRIGYDAKLEPLRLAGAGTVRKPARRCTSQPAASKATAATMRSLTIHQHPKRRGPSGGRILEKSTSVDQLGGVALGRRRVYGSKVTGIGKIAFSSAMSAGWLA